MSAFGQQTGGNRIVVNLSSPGYPVSELLFGSGIEWTENGNNIYSSSAQGIRPAVADQIKTLRLSVLRFPGGILADHYDWRDGVGPLSQRPRRANPMDGKLYENNFGTDEFINLCRATGAQPLITLNAGTGTLEMALSWQQYFRSEGLPVRFFEIGNEIYLAEPRLRATIPGNDKRIYKTATQYSALFNEWSAALRAADSSVVVGAIAGTSNTSLDNRGWLDTLLALSGPQIDYIALHNSFAPMAKSDYGYSSETLRADAYRAMYSAIVDSMSDSRAVSSKLRKANESSGGRLAITEHFPLFGTGGNQSQLLQILDQSKTVAAGMYTASLLHGMIRLQCWMANYNLTISPWFGAILQDSSNGIVLGPHYYVYMMLRDFAGGALLGTEVAGPVFSSPQVGIVPSRLGQPVLDAVAVIFDSSIHLSVINRDLYQSVDAAIDLTPHRPATTADVRTFSGPPNAVAGPPLSSTTRGNTVFSIQNSRWTNDRSRYRFPALSLTTFRWAKNKKPQTRGPAERR